MCTRFSVEAGMHFSLDTILLELRGVASSSAALKVAIYHRPRSNTLGKCKLQVKNTILTTSITAAHMGVLGGEGGETTGARVGEVQPTCAM